MSGMKDIFDPTSRALSSSINLRNIRHDVIATNIANAETPGYKAKVVDFEDALERAVQMESIRGTEKQGAEEFAIGGPGAIGRTRADIYDNPDINTSNDMNSVDMETEIANMKENTIIYNAAIQLMNKKLGALRYAATEGGR
jgi:flagellar basal-body rod protein FlgB